MCTCIQSCTIFFGLVLYTATVFPLYSPEQNHLVWFYCTALLVWFFYTELLVLYVYSLVCFGFIDIVLVALHVYISEQYYLVWFYCTELKTLEINE